MDHQRLAQLLFPDITTTPEDIEKMYPPRNLPEGAKVTRMAPSPTGFMHLGNLFSAIVGERLAHQSNGVFFLRIEDTDLKRAVEGGVEKIINVFNHYGLNFDEGATIDGDNGAYGPYRQRQRANIYQTFAKQLVERGLAYPCFCTEEELTEMREKQQEMKINFGYYGEWAKCRNLSFEEIEANIKAGKPYVLRFRSEGDPNKRFTHHDLVKGDIELPENDQDIVLLKSDGIPTYHFAHVVDDHLMQTTHVVRGEEWLATLNIHLQLFRTMGWKAPKYVHTAQLMKMDGGSKRKLSKRKDPELALDFYNAEGYPVPSVLEYLMTLLNSNFEDWRMANPTAPMNNFQFTTKKMSNSGSLFDIDKLKDVSKNTISVMSADEVYNEVTTWAKDFDQQLYSLLTADEQKAKAEAAYADHKTETEYGLHQSGEKTLLFGAKSRIMLLSSTKSCLLLQQNIRKTSPKRTPLQSSTSTKVSTVRQMTVKFGSTKFVRWAKRSDLPANQRITRKIQTSLKVMSAMSARLSVWQLPAEPTPLTCAA